MDIPGKVRKSPGKVRKIHVIIIKCITNSIKYDTTMEPAIFSLDEILVSSVRISLLSLPYRDNCQDIFTQKIDRVNYYCYEHQHIFNNKILGIIFANSEKVPYGLYARKILHYICHQIFINIRNIALSENISFSNVINNNNYHDSLRLIPLLSKKKFIENIYNKSRYGKKTSNSIIYQLYLLLTSKVTFYESWKRVKNDDARDRAITAFGPFAIVDSNHKVDLLNHWEEEFLMPLDLLEFFIKYMNPIDLSVYNSIRSAMQLDIYQYMLYENWLLFKNSQDSKSFSFENLISMFGVGYKKDSKGKANFKAHLKKTLEGLSKLIPKLKIKYDFSTNCLTLDSNPKLMINWELSKLKNISSNQTLLRANRIEIIEKDKISANVTTIAQSDDSNINIDLHRYPDDLLLVTSRIIDKISSNTKLLINDFYEQHGLNYLEFTIKYAQKHAKNNFDKYLFDCLTHQWARAQFNEINSNKAKEQQLANLKSEDRQKILAEKEQHELNKLIIKNQWEKLSLERQNKIRFTSNKIIQKNANILSKLCHNIEEVLPLCIFAVNNKSSYDFALEKYLEKILDISLEL